MKLKISPFVYIIAVAAVLSGRIQLFLSYIAAIVLHESAHAEVSRRLGYALDEFKIMPYGAALIGKYESATMIDEIKIAIAGPLCNFAFSALFLAVWWLVPELYFFTDNFVFANIYLAVFNLLPFFPLDGGRIALALLGKRFKNNAYKIMRIFSLSVGVLLMALFILSLKWGLNPTLAVISVFMLLSALIPDKKSKYLKLYDLAYRVEKIQKGLKVKYFAILKSTTVRCVKQKIGSNHYSVFRVIDSNAREIEERELDKISKENENMPLVEALNIANITHNMKIV